jgi:redox-sensitive bicupin YhaK (pirin superfamily)
VQVIKGKIEINGEELNASDGAAISEENLLTIKSLDDNSEFLLFDLN